MPKLGCQCGCIINLSNIPCKNVFHSINDVTLDRLVRGLEHSEKSKNDIWDFSDNLREMAIMIIVCPSCGRYHIDTGDGTGRSQSYVPENMLAVEYVPCKSQTDTENDDSA